MARNQLGPPNRLFPDPSDPFAASAPTPADAYTQNANAYQGWLAQQRASGVANGMLDPQTGWPTGNALLDAARQYGGAMIAGTSGPGARGLPMDLASRMSRAEKMGFNIDAYHGGPGTNPYDDSPGTTGAMGTIKQFRAGPEGASFFTSDPGLASDYASARYPERPSVYPVKINSSNMITHDQADGFKSNPELMDMASKAGAHVVEVKNAMDNTPGGQRAPATVYMVLNPAAVRSPHAVFDPREAGSGMITAGVGGLAVGAAAAASGGPDQPSQ